MTLAVNHKLCSLLFLLLGSSQHALSATGPSRNWSGTSSFRDVSTPYSESEIKSMRADLINGVTNRPGTGRYIVGSGSRNGSGGGGGIACLASQEAVDRLNKSVGLVDDKTVGQIQFLQVLDYAMAEKRPQDYLRHRASETPFQYVKRINQEFLRPLRPVIAIELDAALDRVNPRNWLDNRQLPRLNDVGQNFRLPPSAHCPFPVYVQLALRFDRNNLNNDPDIVIDVHFPLMNLLWSRLTAEEAFYNEAVLILHEALYLITTKGNSLSSSDVRPTSTDLLLKQTYFGPQGGRIPGGIAKAVQDRLDYAFPFIRMSPTSARFSRNVGNGTQDRNLAQEIQLADRRLQEILESVARQHGKDRDFLVSLLDLDPQILAYALSLVANESPAVKFVFATQFSLVYQTSIMSERLIAAHIYLGREAWPTFEKFCKAIDFHAIGEGVGEIGKIRTQIDIQGIEYCVQKGIPRMDGHGRKQYLHSHHLEKYGGSTPRN